MCRKAISQHLGLATSLHGDMKTVVICFVALPLYYVKGVLAPFSSNIWKRVLTVYKIVAQKLSTNYGKLPES